MGDFRDLTCHDATRRAKLRDPDESLNGIDYLEISAGSLKAQRFLHVYFFKGPPPALVGNPSLFSVEGGERVTDIRVEAVVDAGDHLVVKVDRVGDFSEYVLAIDWVADGPGKDDRLDPPFSRCAFSFKAGCPSRFDCRPGTAEEEAEGEPPQIDYLAKDYASFRQALVDLIPTRLPEWTDRHEADFGMALVDLLAYVADRLSYYQDAVANEAWLATARQRISVRRHARLIDYDMHDGASARTFVHFRVEPFETHENRTESLAKGARILSRIEKGIGATATRPGPVVTEDVDAALDAADAVFETMTGAELHSWLNEIEIHTWSNLECCLEQGATTADLVGDLTEQLEEGSFLLFEEVRSPETGTEADADPEHRQVVRLTEVESEPVWDPLVESEVTRVTWDDADALRFPLCLSARGADGQVITGVSVARGNLVRADHGRRVTNEMHETDAATSAYGRPLARRFKLSSGPLSFRVPLDDEESRESGSRFLEVDPHAAEPEVVELTVQDTPVPDPWVPKRHLLDSTAFDTHFAVETLNDGCAQIRFGAGGFGLEPGAGKEVTVTYRVGVGRAGNIGADFLQHVVPADEQVATPAIEALRNPLPVDNGVDPESIEQVRRLAPPAMKAGLYRAVTEEDYKLAAELHPDVDRAVARFRWTGSWHTAFVRIDPRGQTDLSDDLREEVADWLARFALAGYDVEVLPPRYAPLEIGIQVCVCPDHFRADVEAAVLSALGNQTSLSGELGFFHPDRFSFGEGLYLSRLYHAVESVPGVDSALVTRFKLLWEPTVEDSEGGPDEATRTNLAAGCIKPDALEVLRLDNDPSFPERGVLELTMLGGKE